MESGERIRTVKLPLTATLSTWRDQRFQDPRDRIYSLLGISTTARLLLPNYNQSRASVFVDVLELIDFIIVPRYFRYVSGPLVGCDYTMSLSLENPVGTYDSRTFKLLVDLILQCLGIDIQNGEVILAIETTMKKGQQSSYEAYLRSYPVYEGRWEDADSFYNDHEDRRYIGQVTHFYT